MSESKTVCPYCRRVPGDIHSDNCKRGRRFRRRKPLFPSKPYTTGYPIASIFDCVLGPLTVRPIAPKRHFL